jgi:hypothetical protein
MDLRAFRTRWAEPVDGLIREFAAKVPHGGRRRRAKTFESMKLFSELRRK